MMIFVNIYQQQTICQVYHCYLNPFSYTDSKRRILDFVMKRYREGDWVSSDNVT